MGTKPGDAAAGVPAHRNRQCGGFARRGRGGTCLGEHRRLVVRLALEDEAVDRPGRCRDRAGSSPVGEQRVDDLLLFRRWARGAPGVRPGRATGAAAVRVAAVGGDRRHGGGRCDLPLLQRRSFLGARLGDRHVHRHCLCARAARPRRPAFSRPSASVHAHSRRRGRHRRARRHRDRLHRHASGCAASRGRRLLRSRPRPAQRPRARGAPLLRPWGRRLGGPAEVRSGANCRRPRHGSPGLRLPGSAVQSRARDRAIPRVPRATHGGLGTRGRSGAQVGDLAQRTVAAAIPPLDELLGCAAVRAGERGYRARRRLPYASLQLADHARDPGRLRRREAGRHSRFLVACDAAEPRTTAAACGLGRGRRGWHDRRDRLHRLAAGRDTRLRRAAARGGEGGHPQRRPSGS